MLASMIQLLYTAVEVRRIGRFAWHEMVALDSPDPAEAQLLAG
jgi:hypothetical protein